ncbi:MAG: cytochrome c oxidase accessory protein CcoG [Leptospiraceae bacterium]|nr:cytochrome c oxidase accessory protein CcoG [Leptospiraceae bacterium]
MVIARPIQGFYRTWKTRIDFILFPLFMILPFIRIGGRPLILLDIPARKFFIFGLTIWPQELYFLHVLLLILGVMLFFFTALRGRIWCGYACPQTLFTDVYDVVGRFVGGTKYGKKTAGLGVHARVYPAWVIISIVFCFVFMGYFVRWESMVDQITAGDIFAVPGSLQPKTWILFWGAFTGAAFFNMVYFRENMCKYVCPYGRFQTALLDKHSPIVYYDLKRGEPRRQKGVKEHTGDCTACNMCNLVCPTGIDIREGLQVGCITCGLCVDACTIEMGKHDKKTLIDYRSIEQTINPTAQFKYLRPRTVVYGTMLFILVGIFSLLLYKRVPIYFTVLRDASISNIVIPGEGVQNAYELHIGNQSFDPLKVRYTLIGENKDRFTVMNESDTIQIPAEGYEKLRLILRYKPEAGETRRLVPLAFKLENLQNPEQSKIVTSGFSLPESI